MTLIIEVLREVAFIENNNEHKKIVAVFFLIVRTGTDFLFPFFFTSWTEKKTTRVHIIVCIFLIYIFFKNSLAKKMHYEYIGGIKMEKKKIDRCKTSPDDDVSVY